VRPIASRACTEIFDHRRSSATRVSITNFESRFGGHLAEGLPSRHPIASSVPSTDFSGSRVESSR
jgi:hypothetical protein